MKFRCDEILTSMIDDDEKIITNNIINTMPYNIYTALRTKREINLLSSFFLLHIII